VLAHESSLGIIEDDKLDWLVDPSIAEPKLNALVGPSDCTMPQAAGEFDNVRGFLGVKTDDERRRVNGINDFGIVRIGTEVLIVLKERLSKKKHNSSQGSPPWPRHLDSTQSAYQRLGTRGLCYLTRVLFAC